MTPSQGTYSVITQTEFNQWDDARQTVVPGVRITARSGQSGQVFTVFVPREQFSPANVDTLIRYQMGLVDEVHGLGS